MKRKQAKAFPMTFLIDCPYCNECFESPSGGGSQTFSVHESVPEWLECFACGEISRAPKRLPAASLVRERARGVS